MYLNRHQEAQVAVWGSAVTPGFSRVCLSVRVQTQNVPSVTIRDSALTLCRTTLTSLQLWAMALSSVSISLLL